MKLKSHEARNPRICSLLLLIFGAVSLLITPAQCQNQAESEKSECRVEPVNYKGWEAQRLSNSWVQLVVVPQNGGRLIQATFAGHDYLFNNPKFVGKYLPPNPDKWFNYGGDKIWLLPEGNNDEQHWAGNSDLIDDGPFEFKKISEGKHCEVELTGPADPQTGVQISRRIQLDNDSPRIRFHASMKNISGHTIEWSMQSVSQYNTSDPSSSGFNHNFWTFTPANPFSAYLNRYHVRFGPAENSAVSVRDDGLFTVHYVHMAAELWLDSTAGWLAVVDDKSQYAMVEHFQYEANKTYPGKASVIFWTNGPAMRLGKDGVPSLSAESDEQNSYLEAELNSPMCRLNPDESCTLATEWTPTRATADLKNVGDAGVIMRPLECTAGTNGKVKLTGSFGVFFNGRLIAHFYDHHGSLISKMPVATVTPADLISLDAEISPPGQPARVSLHLEDEGGTDRGPLQEVQITNRETR